MEEVVGRQVSLQPTHALSSFSPSHTTIIAYYLVTALILNLTSTNILHSHTFLINDQPISLLHSHTFLITTSQSQPHVPSNDQSLSLLQSALRPVLMPPRDVPPHACCESARVL
jgi:hypothetical protein